eukprot:15376530-Alexandrium_andersonii.AAC.1
MFRHHRVLDAATKDEAKTLAGALPPMLALAELNAEIPNWVPGNPKDDDAWWQKPRQSTPQQAPWPARLHRRHPVGTAPSS